MILFFNQFLLFNKKIKIGIIKINLENREEKVYFLIPFIMNLKNRDKNIKNQN
jgi:hypothetical protein